MRFRVAAALAVVFVLSTLPTPLYVAYREVFHFSEVTLTLVYAAYVLGSIFTMIFAGHLSDQIGRRKVFVTALALVAVSTVTFLLTRSTPWLYVARILSGLSIGLASGAGTAWIVELQPRGDSAAGTVLAAEANVIGLGLGPLIAGLLGDDSPDPLKLPYWVLLGLVALGALLLIGTKETVKQPRRLKQASFKPRLGVPKGPRKAFVAPAIAAFATFAVLGYYTSLIPSMVPRALNHSGHAVSGGIVAGLFGAGAVAVATLNRFKPRNGMVVGLGALIPGVALLLVSDFGHSMGALLIGTVIAGAATGLGYLYGLRVINELAGAESRSELVSAYLMVCYLAIALPVIGVGVLSRFSTNDFAVGLFGVLVILFAAAALLFEVFSHPKPRAAAHT